MAELKMMLTYSIEDEEAFRSHVISLVQTGPDVELHTMTQPLKDQLLTAIMVRLAVDGGIPGVQINSLGSLR